MLAWVWLFGLMMTGSTKAATSYLRAWWRVVKWLAVAGMVLGLVLLQIMPSPP